MTPEPRAGEVELWWVDLDRVGKSPPVLDPAERRRVERVVPEAPRRRMAARRTKLRLLLADYTGLDAASLPLATGPHGKPECPAVPELAFNCASSGPVALYAFGRGVRIGVDVEFRADGQFEEMPVRRYMTEHERATVDPVRAWVVKEAVAKAIGVGFDLPATGIVVEWLDPDPQVHLAGDWARIGDADWHVRSLGDERRVAALATDAPVDLRARELSPKTELAKDAGSTEYVDIPRPEDAG
jgi:hypothetical protein